MRLWLALGVLVAASASLLLPPLWTCVLLVALAILWLRTIRLGGWIAPLGLLLALAPLLGQYAIERRSREGRWIGSAQQSYDQLLKGLDAEASRAASHLARLSSDEPRRETFTALQELSRESKSRNLTYVVLDQDSTAIAWAGTGFLHDLEGSDLVIDGLDFISSYTAISIFAVRVLDSEARPWRVVVGRSHSRDELPFAPVLGMRGDGWRWSLAHDSALSEQLEGQRLDSSFGLSLFLQPLADDGPDPSTNIGRRGASVVLGLVCLALLFILVVRPTSGWPAHGFNSQVFLVGLGVIAVIDLLRGREATSQVELALVLAACFIVAALRAAPAAGDGRLSWRFGLGVVSIFFLGLLYQDHLGSLDLGHEFSGNAKVFALRIAMLAMVLSLFQRRRRQGIAAWPPAAALSFAAVLLAAALHDRTLVALPLLAAGAVLAGLWIPGIGEDGRGRAALATVVFAAWSAATAWETAYRAVVRGDMPSRLESEIALPSPDDLKVFKEEIEGALRTPAVQDLLEQVVSPAEAQDLAAALWRILPLARRDALSALVVESQDTGISSFSYGIPLVDHTFEPALLEGRLPSGSRRQLLWIDGPVELLLDDVVWGNAFYWFLPLPTAAARAATPGLELDLLRRETTGPRREDVQPPAELVTYTSGGKPIDSPWPSTPQLTVEELQREQGLARTPEGVAWYFSARQGSSVHRLYLERLDPLAGLERVGVHALASLMVVAIVAFLLLLSGISSSDTRSRIRTSMSSYSRRLIVVFAVLILVPLLALNLVLFQAIGDRLRQAHREAAEGALHFAQQVLADYLLALEPGFGVRSAIDDQMLEWLAQVVQRDINIYWNASYFTSSRPELFSAGLLPKRIPGEVYTSLELDRSAVASRTNRIGDTSYLELYAPLTIGSDGATDGAEPLFYLSTPLLAQEEEISARLDQMARQAVLVTTALFLVLAGVGARLARSFTRPLMEIVEGTGRIAGGAVSLGLQPTEPELTALVTAIDEMAARIAAARRDLMLEKRVVEQVVEHITAGVVSLDRDNRVLMRNQVAGELLGVEVGEPLSAALQRAELAPVASFLAGVRGAPTQSTVSLRTAGQEELEWTLVWVPVGGAGEPSSLFVVEDSTEILRGQRLQAWAEMARIIAHEIKNPLTPIRLATEHLRQVFHEDPAHLSEIFERCTTNILEQVEDLRQISHEFSTYSHIPRADLRCADIREMVATTVASYSSLEATGGRVDLVASETPPTLFDARLLSRALRNLIENALRVSSQTGSVEVEVKQDEDSVVVAVSDRGPGVEPQLLNRIFEPYFSTATTGTGLGLAIARRIVEEHHGSIAAENRAGGGLTVTMRLPIAEAPN